MSSLSISGQMDTHHTHPAGQQALASTSSATPTQQSVYASTPHIVSDSLDLDDLDDLENAFTLRSAIFDNVSSYEDMSSTWYTPSIQPGVSDGQVLWSNDASASSCIPTPSANMCNRSSIFTAGSTSGHESVQALPHHCVEGTITPNASPHCSMSASTSSPGTSYSPTAEEARVLRRRARNKVAARKSRQLRRDYVQGLEQQIASLRNEATQWKAFVDLMEGVLERNGIASPAGYEMGRELD